MQTYKGLPVYTAGLDDDCEITAISLVESPAMELPLFTFSETKEPLQFSIVDNNKHNIIACIVRVDYPIYRVGNSGFGYYLVFQPQTSRELCRRLMRDGYHNCVSKDHSGQLITGIALEEVFIKDVNRGISPAGYEDAADGSLFGIYHITDEELWRECVEGRFGGVSLESYLTLNPVEDKPKENFNSINMSTLRDKIVKMLLQFSSVVTDKVEIFYDRVGDLEVGDEVYTYAVEPDNGERVPVEDGEYETEKYVYVIKDSKVEEIREVETPAEDATKVEAEEETVVEEVKPELDPELISRIEALEERIAALEEEVKKPVIETVEESFNSIIRKTGDNRYDRLTAIGAALK